MTATVSSDNVSQVDQQNDVEPMTEEEQKAAKTRMQRLINKHRKTFEKLAKQATIFGFGPTLENPYKNV